MSYKTDVSSISPSKAKVPHRLALYITYFVSIPNLEGDSFALLESS